MTYKNIATAVLIVLAGIVFSGCDGSSPAEVLRDAGELHSSTVATLCQIPSPAYDWAIQASNNPAIPEVIVFNPQDIPTVCKAWTMMLPGGINTATGQPYPPTCMKPSSKECGVVMTDSVCRDKARDYQDSVGGRHCFNLAPITIRGDDVCGTQSSNNNGRTSCTIVSAGLMDPRLPGYAALCTSDGIFVGWQCDPNVVYNG